MAGSLNKCMLIGNVGKDPEIRTFQNGNRVASFPVATSQSWKDKSTGEKKEAVQWHHVSVLNDTLVGVVEQYVVKGMKIYVEGSMETRKWQDNNGNDRYSTEVVIRPFSGTITFIGSKKDGENNGGQSHQNRSQSSAKAKPQQGGFGSGFGEPEEQQQTPVEEYLDDSIPF